MEGNSHKRSLWTGVGIQLVSFIVWGIIAVFLLGGSRQKMVNLGNDMAAWKVEWKERDKQITRMDLEGSVATKNFIENYNKEQAKQYERLKHLEEQVGHLETMEYRIERLEREEKERRSP